MPQHAIALSRINNINRPTAAMLGPPGPILTPLYNLYIWSAFCRLQTYAIDQNHTLQRGVFVQLIKLMIPATMRSRQLNFLADAACSKVVGLN